MCGRFANQIQTIQEFNELLKIWPDVEPGYNIAPGSTIAAFRAPAGKAMRWGLVPHWSKQFDSEFSTFNARLETAAEKPAFRDAWHQSQRCLIPMLGYYEWQGPKGSKQPYFIRAADHSTASDATGLVAAGLYDVWGGERHYSCTILTRPACSELETIHPRMPVLLDPAAAKEWLQMDARQACEYLMQLPTPAVEFYPVAKTVGNARAQGRKLIAPLES